MSIDDSRQPQSVDEQHADLITPTHQEIQLVIRECLAHFAAGLEAMPAHLAHEYLECMALVGVMNVGRIRGAAFAAEFTEAMARRARGIADVCASG